MRGMAWVVAGAGVAALWTLPLPAQEVHRVAGDDVAIYNLAGTMRLVPGTGSEVVVRLTRGGSDAARLAVETGEVRGRSTLRVVYPDDEIVYPEMGRGSSTTVGVRDDGTFGDGGGGDRVRIRGSGSGLEAWADLVVEVPAGQALAAYLAVGEMGAGGVEGDFRLDTGSGRITAMNVTGSLVVDSGSGSVRIRGLDGNLSADTGSGAVEVSDVTGDEVVLDTGSGRVSVDGLSAGVLDVDTGSGRVELLRISAPQVVVDTGSGSVDLELLTDVDLLELDTGSGSVTVRAPADLGGMVDIETGSGGIDLDFPVEVSSARRDRIRGRLGDGDGTIRIDTGSGRVRLEPRAAGS
ncbi:MAG TPA: DUF4097 family beta strand repeat-containing protein [Longimicrobiales bacterium]|nr:DUF4097 family beta strand repeat-containing protein [Longimicrobiales bacterium]